MLFRLIGKLFAVLLLQFQEPIVHFGGLDGGQLEPAELRQDATVKAGRAVFALRYLYISCSAS